MNLRFFYDPLSLAARFSAFFLSLEFALCFQQPTNTFCDASYPLSTIATRISILYECGLVNAHKWICISNVSSFLDVCFFLRFFISWFCASFPVVDVYFLWCYLTAECHRNPHFHFLWMWVGPHGWICVSYGPLFLAARFFSDCVPSLEFARFQ